MGVKDDSGIPPRMVKKKPTLGDETRMVRDGGGGEIGLVFPILVILFLVGSCG